MIEQLSQRSQELFDSGYCCAESVLMAIAERHGIHSDLIPRIATGFCSGVSRTGGMCGAISGAIMAINLIAGRSLPDESKDLCYSIVKQLIQRFEQQNGSINCRQLLGYDLGIEEGRRFFKENHLIEHCRKYVDDATTMAISLIPELK